MNTREILNTLISKPVVPFTAFKLKSAFFDNFPGVPGEVEWSDVLPFIESNYELLTSSINLPLLGEVFTALKTAIVSDTNNSFTIEEFEQEDPEEVAKFLGSLHVKSCELTQRKEELIHYISFFQSAVSYFTSFKDSMQPFMKIAMPKVANIAYLLEDPNFGALMQDLDSNIKTLKSQVKELNSWVEDILNPKNSHLFKIESSVRLLQKYRNLDGGRKLGVER